MSRERLLNLRNKLVSDGWEVRSSSGETSIESLLHIESEAIEWYLSHASKNIRFQLVFRLFGHFGERTEDLNDISYGKVTDHELELFFTKINKKRWPRESSDFVIALGQIKPP